MGDTKIEWTEKTWNPVTGCQKISPGCSHCYAERIFPRAYHRDLVPINDRQQSKPDDFRQRQFTDVMCHEDRLEQPLHWRKPQKIFVNSMSDLFHENVPFEFIDKVFGVMLAAKEHTFQVLTKRADRMLQYLRGIQDDDKDMHRWEDWSTQLSGSPCAVAEDWPLPNVWVGVSAENQKYFDERVELLGQTPAAVRFVSIEPQLEDIDYGNAFDDQAPDSPYRPIDWVIVGGESGAHARPFNIEWARSAIRQSRGTPTRCFIKQLGRRPWSEEKPLSVHAKFGIVGGLNLIDSHGGDWNEWPADLRVREFPKGVK